MQGPAFEDFVPGTATTFGRHVATREEIVAFAAQFDPQPMHLDEAAAAKSMLGGLSASGKLARMFLRAWQKRSAL